MASSRLWQTRLSNLVNVLLDQQLLALTQEMLVSAQASDWDKLIELEQARQPLFHLVFGNNNVADNEALAREVLKLDETTMELARSCLPVIREQLLKLRDCDKANYAYQSIQHSTSGSGR